jgi:hypothetical protein
VISTQIQYSTLISKVSTVDACPNTETTHSSNLSSNGKFKATEDIINTVMSNSDDNNIHKIQYNNNHDREDKDNDNTESRLLRQTNEEEKARKRTRGPYRKSSAHD